MKLNDAVIGIFLMLLGAVVLVVVQKYPQIPGQSVGPALFPGLIAAGLCIGGLLLTISGLRELSQVPWMQWEDWVHSPRHVRALLVLLGSVLFYMVAAESLGFLLTSVLILACLFYSLEVPLGRSLLIAVIGTLVIHFAFYKLLRVPLPWGILTPYAW
jgi:putative tricarboxylic transport membrane protein